jgi:serine/threonine-protein kinase
LVGGDVTFKSDIYSFGLVLAEALRGRPINMSGSQAEIIEKRRAAPDLSDIQPSIRPLIRSMLQPSPADRPASMAAVADWRDSGGGRGRAPYGEARPAERASRGGRLAAVFGVIIAIVSIGGAALVFRDELARLMPQPTPPPSEQKPEAPSAGLPPLALPPTGKPESPPPLEPAPPVGLEAGQPPPSGTPPVGPAGPGPGSAPPAAGPEAGTPAPAGTPSTGSEKPHVPTADMLADAIAPHAPVSTLALSATVGAPYHAELPAFEDPGGKGLRLSASSLPEGLTFKDLGQGRGEIQGEPKQAGSASVEIVATNRHDMTATMVATIAIGEAPAAPPGTDDKPTAKSEPGPPPNNAVASLEPPHPSIPLKVLDGATVGKDFSADLPAFSAGANTAAITVRAASDPPAGLNLTDLGSGLARLSGKATKAGSYSFEVVATNTAGAGSPMTVRLEVAPAPPPPPENIAKLERQDERADAFLKKFDGGDCFLVKPLAGAGAYEYLAVGAELAPFQRFEEAFKQEVRHDPQLSLRLITSPECPVVEIMRPAADEAVAPRIELADPHVGRNKPLTGTIANLRGRRLYLLLVDNEGAAHRLDAKIKPSGEAANFTVPLTPDPSSVGPMQLIFAVVSAKPIPILETLPAGASVKTIARPLVEAAKSGEASVGADFFVFVN